MFVARRVEHTGRRMADMEAIGEAVVIETEGAALQPYSDGRWWVKEHRVSERFPLVCRGNTGEVYPNVVSPITGSLVSEAFARGQCQLALETGMATRRQLVGFDG